MNVYMEKVDSISGKTYLNSSIITVSATGKIFILKNQQSSGKEETSDVSKEEKVKVVRNARAFSWTEDKYIQDLTLYYDGEVDKLNEEERAECRAAYTQTASRYLAA